MTGLLIAFDVLLAVVLLVVTVRAHRRADQYRRRLAVTQRTLLGAEHTNRMLRTALDRANKANAHFVAWTGEADADVCVLAESLKDNDDRGRR